jgi:hypothetical protein
MTNCDELKNLAEALHQVMPYVADIRVTCFIDGKPYGGSLSDFCASKSDGLWHLIGIDGNDKKIPLDNARIELTCITHERPCVACK